MRIKDGVVIRQVEDEYVLVDTGKIKPKFNGMIKLNETSNEIVSILKDEDLSFDELINKLMDIYDVDEVTLKKEVTDVTTQLKEVNILLN